MFCPCLKSTSLWFMTRACNGMFNGMFNGMANSGILSLAFVLRSQSFPI